MKPFHRPEPLDVLLPVPLQRLDCPLSHSGLGGGTSAALQSAGCMAQSWMAVASREQAGTGYQKENIDINIARRPLLNTESVDQTIGTRIFKK